MKRTESGSRRARRSEARQPKSPGQALASTLRARASALPRSPPRCAGGHGCCPTFPPAPPGCRSGSIRSVERAFYEPSGQDSYVATAATVGPWAPDAQHGGPPSALAARALERHEPDERQRLARVAIDILRPVPVGKLSIRTRTIRPGRRVTLAEAIMEADGQEVLHARGWRIERSAFRVAWLSRVDRVAVRAGGLRRAHHARRHRGGDRRHRRGSRPAGADYGSGHEHRSGQVSVDAPADPVAA